LADMGDMSANFPQSTLNVKGSFMRDNRDVVKTALAPSTPSHSRDQDAAGKDAEHFRRSDAD